VRYKDSDEKYHDGMSAVARLNANDDQGTPASGRLVRLEAVVQRLSLDR
jgi:hypothetical protein